jgi:hypothetical protein
MPRGKTIDSDIKNNLYEFIYDENLFKNHPKIDCILNSASNMIEQYFNEHKETANCVFSELHITQDSLSKKLLQDVVFNLYEHIRILAITYHSDDLDALREFGVIRRNEYLKEKYADKPKEKRNYLDRCNCDNSGKENCEYIHYTTNVYYKNFAYYMYKFSKIYHDYIFRTVNNILFVDKKYSGILDYFYASSTNSIRKQLKMYTIWDVNHKWLPEIQNLYNSCDTTLQLHLAERLYGIITAMKIYKSKSDSEDICFANMVQPLTLFGCGASLEWLVRQYKVSKYHDYTKSAGFLFNALSFVFKNVLYGILREVNSLNTNIKKSLYIDELYNEYDFGECKEILEKASQNYKESIPLKIKDSGDTFMALYKDILFNGKFKMYASENAIYQLGYGLTHNIDDDLDDDLDDETHISDLNISFKFDDCQGKLEHYFNSMFYDMEVGKTEEIDEEEGIYSFSSVVSKVYIFFGFSDYLYLITELSYEEFYQRDV